MNKLEKFKVEELEQRFETGWKEPVKVDGRVPDLEGVGTTWDV